MALSEGANMIRLFTAQLVISLMYLFDTTAINIAHLPVGFWLLTAVYLSAMLETYLVFENRYPGRSKQYGFGPSMEGPFRQ